MATKKEVAVKEQSQMALFSDDRPDYVNEHSNRGSEDVTLDDITLPRIDVIQALSPQIKKSDAKYIPGAEQGNIFNTVTEHIYGNELVFVPVFFRKEWLVWKKRTEGGGFRGAFETEEEANAYISTQDDRSALEAIDTAQHYVMVVGEDKLEQAVISMSRSKMKVSRQLNSMVRMSGGDRFSRAYKLAAIEDSSDRGDYWNFKVSQLGYVPEAIFKAGEDMYDAVKSGSRTVDYSDVKEHDEKDEF